MNRMKRLAAGSAMEDGMRKCSLLTKRMDSEMDRPKQRPLSGRGAAMRRGAHRRQRFGVHRIS